MDTLCICIAFPFVHSPFQPQRHQVCQAPQPPVNPHQSFKIVTLTHFAPSTSPRRHMLAATEALVSAKQVVLSYGGCCVIYILRVTEDRLCDGGEAVALVEWSHVPNLAWGVRKDERREKKVKRNKHGSICLCSPPKVCVWSFGDEMTDTRSAKCEAMMSTVINY